MRGIVVFGLAAMAASAVVGLGPAQALAAGSPSAGSASGRSTSLSTSARPARAATPPMGWNSWNAYACDNSAKNMKAVAAFIHTSGLEKDGYRYVNADGCYDDLEGLDSPNTYGVTAPTPQDPETCGAVNGRLPDGELFVNTYAFPPSKPCANNGFGVVSSYVHGLGLKMGIYYDASNNWNCEEIPGTYGFDKADARSLARWKVDYVKLDWGCSDDTVPPGSNAPTGYQGIDAAPGNQGFGGPTFATNPAYTTDQQHTQIKMYTAAVDAIRDADPSTVISIAGAGTTGSEQWGLPMADLDRPTGDANANFSVTGKHAAGSVVGIVNSDATTYDALTMPGHWIDPDPMEIGNGTLTADEDRSEMSMFSEMTEPLLMSTNLCPRNCGADTAPATADQLALATSVFGNKRVIAVDQDPLASPAHIVGTFDGTHLVMEKPLADGGVAVTLFNESTTDAATMSASAADLGLSGSSYQVRDLWSNQVTTSADGSVSATVAPTATVMYRITPTGSAQGASSSTTATPIRGTARTQAVAAAPAYRGPGNLMSVSCATASRCAAVDQQGRLVTFDPTSRSTGHRTVVTGHRSLVSISCPGTASCVALDSGGGATTFRWTGHGARRLGRHVVDRGQQPTALDCVTTARCTLVDGHGTEVTFNPGNGRIHGVSAVAGSTYLDAVTCPTATQCTAAGGGGNNGDTEVTFDPANGKVGAAGVLAVDPATGNGVSSVACPSATQCSVVDGSGNEVTFDPTNGTILGSGVSALEGADLAAGLGVLTSLDCPTTAACTAVDASGNEVTFDPTSGTPSSAGVSAVDPGHGLQSVVCTTGRGRALPACEAVDLAGRAISFDATTGSLASPGVTTVDRGRR